MRVRRETTGCSRVSWYHWYRAIDWLGSGFGFGLAPAFKPNPIPTLAPANATSAALIPVGATEQQRVTVPVRPYPTLMRTARGRRRAAAAGPRQARSRGHRPSPAGRQSAGCGTKSPPSRRPPRRPPRAALPAASPPPRPLSAAALPARLARRARAVRVRRQVRWLAFVCRHTKVSTPAATSVLVRVRVWVRAGLGLGLGRGRGWG